VPITCRGSSLRAMPWKPAAASEVERKVEALSLKLLQANAALRSKRIYAERLEVSAAPTQ